jgi:hypothetical protein
MDDRIRRKLNLTIWWVQGAAGQAFDRGPGAVQVHEAGHLVGLSEAGAPHGVQALHRYR